MPLILKSIEALISIQRTLALADLSPWLSYFILIRLGQKFWKD